MATSAKRSPILRTACDRCYELKERCERTTTTLPCTRCDRLGSNCLTIRPVRRSGRRPQNGRHSAPRKPSTKSNTVEQCHPDNCAWLNDVPDLLPQERELLMYLLGRPESLDYYVVCPSFQAAERQSLMLHLPAALPVLKDAYLACAGALRQLQSGIKTEIDNRSSIRHASSALKVLRSLTVSSSQDAALCLTLGTALALSVYSIVGVGVSDICHYCLSMTNQFVGKAALDPRSESLQNLLVLFETMDCLVHRRKPTLRIQERPQETVDRHLGLCLPLLPYYYDLCVISHSLANQPNTSYLARFEKQLDAIHSAVEAWRPSHPDHFVDQFESAEIINLLSQARVYRLGALLVSHRLRHAFGQQDDQADIWSKEIMMELELALTITKRPIRCASLPFIAAAVEIRDPGARIQALQKVDDYVDHFTPILQQATRTFLSRIWRERDFKTTQCWFDSIHKPCAVLHSIDVACLSA